MVDFKSELRTNTKSEKLSRWQQKKHNQDQKTKQRTNQSNNKQTKKHQTTIKTKQPNKKKAGDQLVGDRIVFHGVILRIGMAVKKKKQKTNQLCRNAAAECYLCVLNCTKRDTLCQQRVQPRIQKLALANYQIPLSNAKQYLQKNTQCGLRFGSRFLTPKWGQSPRLIYFCNNNGADSHFGSRFPAPKMGANFESFFFVFQYRR